ESVSIEIRAVPLFWWMRISVGLDLPAALTALRNTLALAGAWKVQYRPAVAHSWPLSPGCLVRETTYDTFCPLARNCFEGCKNTRRYFTRRALAHPAV
uniref:Uncharacterized protein n=1 Tax=Neogobius melanostomus TaxID=47308 RepID=A0A8C6WXZ5_9GOBI